MFKKILPILIATLLSANTISTNPKILSLDAPFEVESNLSIFETDSTGYTHQDLLKCTPSIEAAYRILSPTKLRVIPRRDLQSDTIYSCSYNQRAIELYTQPFMLLDYHFFTKERIIRLQFNDKVDLKSIKSAITLQKKERLSRTDLHYSITQHNEQTLLLKIDEPIGHHGIVLRINEQLQTTHQSHLKSPLVIPFDPRGDTPVTLNKEKEPMIIHDRPQMVSLPSGEFAIRIFLDDTLEGRSERFISIDGITNFRLNKNNYITYEERREHNLSDESYYYTDIISSEFKPNSTYHLTLHKGLHHYQELKEDQSFTFKTKDRAKTITFQADKPYISSNGELAFSSVNINQATLIVERILEQNLRYFVNFSSAQKRDISRYIKEVTSKEIILNNPKNIITKQKFKLSQLAKPLPFGIYRITLRYRDGDREKSSSTTLFLSNLGISANLAKDQAIITILSLDTATPTPNAKVELYGKNNQLIGTATTDQDGVAIIEKRDLLLENPKGVIVSYKGDKNFLALNHTIHSPYPEEILQKMERFKAHIYFQSRLVRPQGEVHALITIKDRDFISASKIPVEIELEELYGESITKKIYHTDKFGLIDFSYQFDKEDQTGSYRLIVRMGENILGERTFKLESFLPPKIENHITLNQESYTIGESIEVNLSTNYLFGADAAGLQGDIKLITQPVAFHAKAFQGYTFDNPYLKAENTQNYLHYHESIQLDNRGKTNIIIPTHTHQKIPSILQAMIGVTIMDDTQPVATYHPLTLYPYPEMVGIKLEQKSLQKDQKLQGRVILIDPKSQKPINRDLYATIKRVEWHYSYTDDNYVWERELIDIDSFTIPANEPFVYPIDGYGEFILEIKDILGGHSAATNFDLWGDHYSNLSPKDNLNSLEIKIDEHLYQQGENLVATIKSPILEGELYVMLESDKLISHKHYRITKGVAKIELPINQPIPHGAYLHAVVYRPSDSSNRLIPFRAIGYHYIKPNRNEHKIDIQLNTPPKIHANSTIKLGIKTDKPAKVLISIVDKGILQLASQKDPKLFDYFNEQPNRVFAYYDLYDQLLAYLVEGRLIDFGAGDIDGINRKKKHLPPDLGKRIKPFMIWSGVIENSQKSRELTINIPEFNGKATIVAIAINEDSLGLLTEDITIKDDIMIKPSYPLYLLSKDSVNLPIRLFNTTNEPKKVHLLAKSSENLTIGLKHPDIQLNPHSSKLITAQLKANKEGKGEIELRAIFGQKEVSSHIELPIYNPYALSTKTYKGIGANPITIPIPKAYQGAKAIITLSDNLIGSMREDLKYLVGYPYGCAEQTSSQIAAMHYAKIFFKEDRLIKESQNFIRQGVKKLRNMQNYYGEFEYWRYGGYINPYASLYAAQTLLELQRDGMDVDKRLIDKSIAMLKSVTTANGNYQATYSDFHRLYAAYILSEAKMLDTSMLNMLQEKAFYKKHFLSSYYMAAILKMSGKTTQAQQLYSSVGYHLQDYPKRAYRDHSGNFESNIRDMLLHFIIKTKYFHKDPKDLATIQRHLNELYSTQERAIALKAVSLYLGKPKRAKLHATLNINNQKREYHKPTTLTIDKLQGDTLLITPQSGAISYSIELIKHLPKEPKNQLSNKQPLSIMRQFVDDSNQPISINNLHQGEKIYSKITIANMQRIDNVVINQRIPACLSIVNHRIQNELTNQQFANQNINQQHQEILDDRVINILNLPLKKSTNPHQSIQNRGILYTPLIVTTKGECQLPAVITEAMYDSRIQDYAKEEMPLMIK
jgi:uncharacterized protein YfaS (alpha-2-macroglobulin family)